MTSPYQLLEVGEHSTDAEIKQAYLKLVKDNPPDRDQERFRQIQQAYETIKDADSRLHYALFNLPNVEFNELLDFAFRQESEFRPMPADDFCKLLNAISADKALSKAFASRSS